MKKFTRLVFSIIMVLLVFMTSMAADNIKNDPKGMDDLDKLLIAQKYLSDESDIDMWKEIDSVKEIVNLYDLDDNVIAYYISFKPKGYAIVNNNLDNPIAIDLEMVITM